MLPSSGPQDLLLDTSGSGPALLCLHGVGGCGAWFRGLAERLKHRFRILALDLPGTGVNREGQAPFSLEHSTEVLAHYLTTQEPEPVSILGHSLGTMIGMQLALACPEKVRAMLCVGGLPAVTRANHQRLSERREIIRKQGMAGLGWKAAMGNFSRTTLADKPEILALYARLWESQSALAYIEGIDALLSASLDHLTAAVKIPCWVLRGCEDGYAPPEESRRFFASLPGTKRWIEMPDCAHMPFLESPAAFAGIVTEFLDVYTSPSGE